MDKIKCFEKELIYIKNPQIKTFTEKAIENMPDYFFEVSASSTGKFHPTYALGAGGLLRHTRATIRIAVEMFRMEMFNYFSSDEKDLILASLFIHDGRKSGNEKQTYTVAEHPLLQAMAIQNNDELKNTLPKEQIDIICDNVRSHMGHWNADYKTGEEILPKPKTRMQNFVHMCDFLASRKCLEMNFDVELSN